MLTGVEPATDRVGESCQDRFHEIERLEQAVVAGLGTDVTWEIRGEQAVLRAGQGVLGLRLELVPCEAGRVSLRLEGDMATPELEALLRSLPLGTARALEPIDAERSADGGAGVFRCRA